MNFTEMTYEQLKLARDEIDALLRERRTGALEELTAKAQAMGFSMNDIMARLNGHKQKPKYRNPDDPSQTYSGRGRKPAWLQQALDQGRALEEFSA
jgi:DNA-binding protein H-NS